MGRDIVAAAIYNEKYYHSRRRRRMDLPAFGRIQIIDEEIPDKPTMVRLVISIPYSGDNI